MLAVLPLIFFRGLMAGQPEPTASMQRFMWRVVITFFVVGCIGEFLLMSHINHTFHPDPHSTCVHPLSDGRVCGCVPGQEVHRMSSTKSLLAVALSDKEYRDAFVASQLRIGLPMQCRALRENREMTQARLSEITGMSQPRISEIESPGARKFTLETLLRLASAFDVALQVRFVPFNILVNDDEAIDLNSFYIPSFEEDIENSSLAEIDRLQRMEGK